jgi:DNA replication and repair protein RecF
MVLTRLKLEKFRNYRREEIQFNLGTNILFGNNGQGKTNILESLYYLSLTKSFRTNNDQNLILNGENFFSIQGSFISDQGRKNSCMVSFSLTDGKHLNHNRQKIQKVADYIGTIPVVLLAPSDLDISQGGPQKRRQFLDIMLSQSSKLYLHHLLQYRRSLRQRNFLLQKENKTREELHAWEDALIENGSIIVSKRLEALEHLEVLVKEYYRTMSGTDEKIKMVYQSSIPSKQPNELEEIYRAAMGKNFEKDVEIQTTSVGPHRDDILFLKDGKVLRWLGSQGEHKTFIISLKMAEFGYLQNIQKEPPMLLFDDIFGELDAGRITNLIKSVTNVGQVFITTTSPHFFHKVEEWNVNTHFYEIEGGTVKIKESA